MRFLHELVTVLEGDVRKGPGITDGQQPLGDREGGRTILLSQETCLCIRVRLSMTRAACMPLSRKRSSIRPRVIGNEGSTGRCLLLRAAGIFYIERGTLYGSDHQTEKTAGQ